MSELKTLWRFDLTAGHSSDPRKGASLMDAVSWFEYGRLDDHPACTCPVTAAFCREVNDLLPDDERQRLKPYIPRLAGTVDRDAEKARGRYLARQAVTVFTPHALAVAGFGDQAAALAAVGSLALGRKLCLEIAARATVLHDETVRQVVAYSAALKGAARHGLHPEQLGFAVRRHWYARLERCAEAAARAAGERAPVRVAEHARNALWALARGPGVYAIIEPTLDGLLAIGKQGDGLDVPKLMKAARRFAQARSLFARPTKEKITSRRGASDLSGRISAVLAELATER